MEAMIEELNQTKSINPKDFYLTNKDKKTKIKVAFYGRVSTTHEAQLSALINQKEWYHEQLRYHSNWELYEEYIDEGITGTSCKKRKNFLRMIEDAKNGLFDLIITREISRFSRNTIDSLKYTRELKRYNVEIFFVNDGLWTFDVDSELRIAIMGALAQDEARHVSERSKAGQMISREKGVLYGNGNLLGYNLVKTEKGKSNYYTINSEQAETVKMIFDMYTKQGMGTKKIASELIARHRKNASGNVKWTGTYCSRVLDNRTYTGKICYNKSVCVDFLEHRRKKMSKENETYVDGGFPAIISEEDFEKAQRIKKANTLIIRNCFKTGKRPTKDKWVKKLRCCCGATFKKYKWRTNRKSGEECFGYRCNNQVNNRKKSFIKENGLDTTGYCDVPGIPIWKLEFQLQKILINLWKNPNKTIHKLTDSIQRNFVEDHEDESETNITILNREKQKIEVRLKNLTEMRLDGEIDKETFTSRKAEYTQRYITVCEELSNMNSQITNISKEDGKATIERVKEALKQSTKFDSKIVDEDIVEELVERVVPSENGIYKWYLNIGTGLSVDFCENEFLMISEFVITFEEAVAYRKKFGNYLRKNQWNDIKVRVYIKM